MRYEFVIFSILSLLIAGVVAYFYWPPILWSLVLLGPIILLGFYDMFQSKHAIMRNFPILGRGRYIMEDLRPKMYQYFIESDTNGTPINRVNRSLGYQRAKQQLDTSPFGTQINVYEEGYEWMNHSIGALDAHDLVKHPRVFHAETIESFVELLATAGLASSEEVNRSHIYRRVNMRNILRYDQIYPPLPKGALLAETDIPANWTPYMEMADPNSFKPRTVFYA